ncbi:MAG TPA: hypothetical protein VGC27_05245 [Rhizomicrobium sp.]
MVWLRAIRLSRNDPTLFSRHCGNESQVRIGDQFCWGGPSVREAFAAPFSRSPDGEALRRIHDAPGLAET